VQIFSNMAPSHLINHKWASKIHASVVEYNNFFNGFGEYLLTLFCEEPDSARRCTYFEFFAQVAKRSIEKYNDFSTAHIITEVFCESQAIEVLKTLEHTHQYILIRDDLFAIFAKKGDFKAYKERLSKVKGFYIPSLAIVQWNINKDVKNQS